MSQTISQYIEQQMEAARVERKRQTEAHEAEEARKLAEKVALSSKNLLRVLSLMGIEAGQGNLAIQDEFVSFVIGNIRIWLKGREFTEEDTEYHKKPIHNIRFELSIKHILVDWEYSYPTILDIHEHSESGVIPSRLSEKHIMDFFKAIVQLEEQYAYLLKPATTSQESEAVSEPDEPRFTYTGDSREEILAHVLRDIQADYYPEVEF